MLLIGHGFQNPSDGMRNAPVKHERAHGYSARVLVMGLYGIKNVKWVSELDLVEADFKGTGRLEAGPTPRSTRRSRGSTSQVPVPRSREGPRIGWPGSPWVGTAGSAPWKHRWRARVATHARQARDGSHTWVCGPSRVPTITGTVTLMVRAVDGTGATQPTRPKPPLPDGVEGLHRISVTVT